MYSEDDLKSLHGFLRSTGEGNLQKMLVGGRMTDAHLRVLLKVARACNEGEFATHWLAETFPKVKFSAGELAIKEGCYNVCGDACVKLGLMAAPAKVAKAA
jgi:hypothetical protein